MYAASISNRSYEKAVDTEKDAIEMSRKLYLPINSALYTSVETSPLEAHQV